MNDDSVDNENNFLCFQWDVNNVGNESNQSQPSQPIEKALREVVLLNEDDNTVPFGLGRNNDDPYAIVRRINTPCLRIGTRESGCCVICNLRNLRGKNKLVQTSMGTMAQCRGARGDALRVAGAIRALLDTLWRLMVAFLPPLACTTSANEVCLDTLCDNHLLFRGKSAFSDIVLNELEMSSIDLANSCIGALRDLACGSALNRAAILGWTPSFQHQCGDNKVENGVHILSAYVKRYDQWTWEEIRSLKQRVLEVTSTQDRGKKEMRLLTSALGAVRNASHSAPDVCQEFFNHGLVDSLVRRLMPQHFVLENPETTISVKASTSLLPEASCPWREACFRAAGSLINLAEKCPHVARQLGSNRECILLLMETWGGAKAMKIIDPNKTDTALTRGLPLLHLGLAAILHAAENGALDGGLDAIMMQVIENERMRKRIAQRREEERKVRQIKTIK